MPATLPRGLAARRLVGAAVCLAIAALVQLEMNLSNTDLQRHGVRAPGIVVHHWMARWGDTDQVQYVADGQERIGTFYERLLGDRHRSHTPVEVTYDARDPSRMTIGRETNAGPVMGHVDDVLLVVGLALSLRWLYAAVRCRTMAARFA
jgi:hypothetical protein